jgi:hypothetical protein
MPLWIGQPLRNTAKIKQHNKQPEGIHQMKTSKAPKTQEREFPANLLETEQPNRTQNNPRPRKRPRLLRKAEKLQEDQVEAYKYYYNVLANAVDRLCIQAADVMQADEHDMLWLASMSPKEVKAFGDRLRKIKRAVDAAATEVMGPNRSTWFQTHYDPTSLETCMPPW